MVIVTLAACCLLPNGALASTYLSASTFLKQMKRFIKYYQ